MDLTTDNSDNTDDTDTTDFGKAELGSTPDHGEKLKVES